MKTFLLNIPNEIRNWNNTLDAKSVLCNQSWNVFNDEGVKEVYIFQKDGTLIASHNGKVTKAKWEYIPQNTSLIIENLGADTFMLRPTYYDKKVLALQVDGTDNYALMVDENFLGQLMLDSIDTVRLYIRDQSKYQEQILGRVISEKDRQETRIQEWNKFIDERIEEYMRTSESLKEIEEIKHKKEKTLYITILLLFISLCIIFIPDVYSLLSAVGIFGIVIVLFLFAHIIGDLSVSGYKTGIRKKMENKYPLESFK
jgi:hypothetical protein